MDNELNKNPQGLTEKAHSILPKIIDEAISSVVEKIKQSPALAGALGVAGAILAPKFGLQTAALLLILSTCATKSCQTESDKSATQTGWQMSPRD